MEKIESYEKSLIASILPELLKITGLEIYGPLDPAKRTGIISFNLKGLHPHDVATALDMEGVAIRAGHHCAQPLMEYLNVAATARASFYLYNTIEDGQRLVEAIRATKEFFKNGIV